MDLRKDFPILQKNPDLVYLDSACTSLKPAEVIEAEAGYYRELGACGGRSSHSLGRKTSEALDQAREKVAGFVGASAGEMIWTRNTTEALNIVINGMDYSERRKVVTSVMEHHAVLLPLMGLRDAGMVELEVLNADAEGHVGEEAWERAVDGKTALAVTSSWSNTTGSGSDIGKIARICHDSGALLCVDGAQGVPHHKTDFTRSGADFLCFSGHKMLGPSGIGALVARKGNMERIAPNLKGGGTVGTVSLDKAVPLEGHARFEAGVQDYAGIMGLAAACGYLRKIGMERVEEHGKRLSHSIFAELRDGGAIVYGRADPQGRGALYSFNIRGAKPHDLALLLDHEGIAVRSGYFCAQPAMQRMGAREGAVRASAYIYNTEEDIRRLGSALMKLRPLYT